jgi:hypothetical protein
LRPFVQNQNLPPRLNYNYSRSIEVTRMSITPDDAMKWLSRHANRPIRIEKLEQSDRDEVLLELHDVELRSSRRFDPEHYAADEAILLHGSGQVVSGGGTVSPLPLETYEIPLDGGWKAHETGNALQIANDRAAYTIMPLDKNA